MKIFKKGLSVLMVMTLIITPLIPSKAFANPINSTLVKDTTMGTTLVDFYYDAAIGSYTIIVNSQTTNGSKMMT